MQQPVVMHSLGGKTWQVDRVAAGQVMPWVAREPKVWAADLAAMAAHFPHWALVGGEGHQPGGCRCGGGPLAPIQGALRCASCGAAGQASTLLWVGHLPVLARPEPSFGVRRQALRAAGFAETNVGGLVYLLVPMCVVYPREWPGLEPVVHYAPAWLRALQLPEASGAHHLYFQGRACLFGFGQWRPMTVAAVLQQRVLNHLVSLLKVAAGVAPTQAFIGKVAH
jgi:hypothetical protein